MKSLPKNSNIKLIGKAKPQKPKLPKSKPVKKKPDTKKTTTNVTKTKKEFPNEFPFWARLKISKNRTTIVIDEENAFNKKTNKPENLFVHREATHTYKRDYEKIDPNPDKDDPEKMYLKRPRKHPKRMFAVHNKELAIPQHLISRYKKSLKK